MTEQKKSSKRETTIGQRVPADVRTKFNDFAQKKMKCTAAELLRALMEATYSGNAKTSKKELNVHVTVGKGVVGSEVVSKLDQILSLLNGKTIDSDKGETLVIEPEPIENFAAVFNEASAEIAAKPASENSVFQEAIPKKAMNIDPNGWLILKTTYDDLKEVKALGATRRDNQDGSFLAWVVSPQLKDKFEQFERWF